MVSIIYNIVSFIKSPISRVIFAPLPNIKHPKVKHKILEESFVSQFEEIFVIGDVHGCFDELIELLNKADATKDSTLKIFVGDMLRKGPHSMKVLHFVKNNESVLCVRGNHDEVVLDNYFNRHETNLKEEDNWIKELSENDILFIRELPYTINIPSLKAIIVHAGLIPGIPLEQNSNMDMVTMRNLIINEYFGKGGIQASKYDKEGESWASLWPGPEHIFFGHDAKRKLQIEAFATGLDTGCVYGGSLTGVFISGPKHGTLASVNPRRVYCAPKKKN